MLDKIPDDTPLAFLDSTNQPSPGQRGQRAGGRGSGGRGKRDKGQLVKWTDFWSLELEFGVRVGS